MNTLLIALLVSQNMFAKTYGGIYLDEAHSIVQTIDGGYAIIGFTSSYGPGPQYYILVKLAPTGDVSWTKVIPVEPNPSFGNTPFLIQTADGGYAIAGSTISSVFGGSAIVIKLTSTGDMEWAKTYDQDGTEYGLVNQRIAQTADGGYVVHGMVWGFGSDGWAYSLAKLNSSGDVQWAWLYDAPQHDNGEGGFCQTQNGSYVMVGYSRAFGLNWDAFVIKVDNLGTWQWARAYGGVNTDKGVQIVQTTDLGYLIAGTTSSYGAGNSDLMIIKIDNSGDLIQWARAIGGSGDDRSVGLAKLADGGFLVTGYTQSAGGGQDILLLKIDDAGNLLWTKTLGGADTEVVWGLTPTTDGGFAIVGMTKSYGAGGGDLFVLKTDANGNYTGCLADWSPQVMEVTPSVTVATQSLINYTPRVTSSNPALTAPSPTVNDVCQPLDVEEGYGFRPKITCSPIPAGALFFSPDAIGITIYKADGRLAYSRELNKGENRIKLETGVYLWKAGTYKGKAIVR